MESQELPDALRPYAQAIEAFGWSRFIARYEAANPEQQEGMRMAIWMAAQTIENVMQELSIDRAEAAGVLAELFPQLAKLSDTKGEASSN